MEISRLQSPNLEILL